MLAIARIQINHLKEPAGIQGKVRVGWEITSDHRNVIQKGYQMQVAKDDGFKEVVYDTGMREDGESQNISLDMPDLESIRYYYVRVKIWDNYEEVSDWHRTHFLSALSDHEFIIYLLVEALADENAFKNLETWSLTEGLAEYYLKKIMGDTRFFSKQQKYVEYYENCEKEFPMSAVQLYRKAMAANKN